MPGPGGRRGAVSGRCGVIVLWLVVVHFARPSEPQPAVSDFLFNTTGFACSGCLAAGADGGPVRIRAMFFEKPGVVQNDAAERIARLEGIPHDCASRAQALPQCFRAEHWDKGWVGELFFDIVQETGGDVVAMTAANFSDLTVHAAGDALLRCAWEVQLGLVDVCVGDVWETDARRIVSPFTSPIDVDVFKFVTTARDATFAKEQLLDFTKPFELNVWIVTVATAALGGLLTWAVDDRTRHGWWIDTSRRGRAVAVLRWSARQLVLLGFAVFAIFLTSCYVAWLSHHIAEVSPGLKQPLVSSVADAISSGRPLCMLRSAVGLIQQPGMKVEAVDSVWRALENIQSSRCVGAIIGKDDYLTYVAAQTANYDRCPSGQTDLCLDTVNLGECLCTDPGQDPGECPDDCPDYHRFCDLFQVLDPDFSAAITVGLPVRAWLQDILSAWIVKKRLSGDVQNLRRLYIEDPNPPICEMESKRTEGSPVSLESVAGIFVLSGSLMLLGFFWHRLVECCFPSRDPAELISIGANYRTDRSKRGIPQGFVASGGAPNATEFRLEALSLVDNMRNALEQTTGRNEERLIRQEERIVRQDRKLDELRAVVDDLNGKLGTEMAEETQNYETQLSVAVARLKVSEEEILDKQREILSAQGVISEREKDVIGLQLQLQETTSECVNVKQMLGERVGEVFELKQRLAERDGEIQQLKEARVASVEELMQAKGQLGEKSGQVHELRQQYEEARAESDQVQARLNQSLAEISRLKMQMDLQIELHAERELELSNFAGNNAGEAHELRQQNEERWSELQRLREGAGERAGEMFELRQALSERTEEIIDLKGQLGERAWELLEVKQQLGERAGEVLAANEALKESRRQIDEIEAQCQDWKWQANELRKEVESLEHKLEVLTKENTRMFGDNNDLRRENKTLEEVAARHVDEKFELSEQLEKSKTSLDQAVKERANEIADLKLLVGQHAAETLEARTLLQDRCRDIVVLEGKIKESEDHIENLKTESAMRKMEVEEQRQQLSDQSQQMSVLWDLGSKVQSLLEMDLGNKVAHMAEILEKVDCVLDSKDATFDSPHPPRPTVPQVNGCHVQNTPNSQGHAPHNLHPYETSNTYAPETMAATQSMEASHPVPPISFKPPQTIMEWNNLAHQFTPAESRGNRTAPSSRAHPSEGRHTPQSAMLSPSEVLSPRSVHSHASSSVSRPRLPGHDGRGANTPDRPAERRTPSAAPSGLSQGSATTYY